MSLVFLFSVSTVHLRSSSVDHEFRPKTALSFNAASTCVADTSGTVSLTREQWDQCLEPGPEPSYYLSIVIVTRMDDYAGNQHHRLQNFIDSAYLLAEHTREKIELLVVEWNPPKDRRRFLDAFRFRRSEHLTYRIITVPDKIHEALPNRGDAPLHEFEGKNVGIRFARGEFVVCTNQDDIWSHNFHNAIKSRAFKKDIIYLQRQDRHNIHENLPPTIVNLPAMPDDDMLYMACQLNEQDWGKYQLPDEAEVTPDNLLRLGDQAGDFTMAHRDTWKKAKGYRESGGVAWVDIEFIGTARWTFDIPVVYSDKGFTCHQEHKNVWEAAPERMTDNKNVNMGAVQKHEIEYVNEERKWALQHIDIWGMGLECFEFLGGLCW
ncbi:hypothetical protein BDB00DRAFT_772861 [Zychaea mexicana]|uniref:uncharacterized protein n=1 Tax=Zychaea mexicana TaxID=64656 RepID=UPI0022FF376F|nr:uncharacterized protein BDB00DRAFT_772861 [Zychaea mexicana]KAI9488275.1 hypothetical protein BDB00DRAFT_772861 [Zychaea mexicana]